MKRIKVRAADIKQGDEIFIETPHCSPKSIGTATGNAVIKRGFATFRVQFSKVYSGARKHWPNTKILVGR